MGYISELEEQVLNIDLSGNEVETSFYNSDNGHNAAAEKIIEEIRMSTFSKGEKPVER